MPAATAALLLLGCLLAPLAALADRTPSLPARPNFVILVADDLGWNDSGAYGNPAAYTPHIDQLAAGGVRFTSAFLTSSSCSASRASLLTGRYPHSNGLVHLHQSLPAQQRLFTSDLRAAGYYTAAVGKWHIGGESKRQLDRMLEDREDAGTDHWLAELRARPRDRPFFFWLASRDPHVPHTGGREFAEKYDVATLPLPSGFIDGPGVREELLQYYLEVSRFDADVGRVVAELRAQGVLEKTVVILLSDNGRPFFRAKTWLYDDGLKTPLIVHWPDGLAYSGDFDGLVSAVDLAPTVLELAGLQPGASYQGRSFRAALIDRDTRTRQYVFAERNWHGRNAHERAVRSADFLYKENQFPLHGDCINSGYNNSALMQALKDAHKRRELDATTARCFAEKRPPVELFAVSSAGTDLTDLSGDPQYQAQLAALAAQLREWREATADFDYTPYDPPNK